MEQKSEAIRVPIVFVGAEDLPLLVANRFVIQHDLESGDFFVTIGQVQPPILLGSPKERDELAKQISFVPVKAVARFGLSYQHIVELINVLQQNVKVYEEQKGIGSK